MLTPASLAVITSTFSGAERGAAIGTWTAWSGMSTVVGPLLGGWLIGVTSWRVIFLLNVPVAIATLVVAFIGMPRHETRKSRREGRLRRRSALRDRARPIVFGFIEQPTRGWSGPGRRRAVSSAAHSRSSRSCCGRGAHGSRCSSFRLFTLRNFSVANTETFALYGGLSSWGFFLVLFLQQLAGYSPFQAGLATLPVTIVMFVLSRYVGRWSMTIGPRLFMGLGPAIAGISVDRTRAPAAGSELLDRPVPADSWILDRSRTDGRAAHHHGALGRRAERRGHRVGDQQRDRAHRRPDRDCRDRHPRVDERPFSENGFHTAMLITGALICLGAIIGASAFRTRS